MLSSSFGVYCGLRLTGYTSGRILMNVPQCINVGDGGIDALIENAAPSFDEVIPPGTSGFQIKSSDLSPNKCRLELH